MKLKTLAAWKEKDLRGKRVLVRADFNVPMAKGKVGETWRIAATLPTIRYLTDAGARVILASHLGRPEGKRVSKLSLRPVAQSLGRFLGRRIAFSASLQPKAVERAIHVLKPGGVLLLENLRFHPGEEKNSSAFAKWFAGCADLFVNDAFASSHRESASIAGVPRYLPSAAGFLLAKEVSVLSALLGRPAKPFFVLIGGEKIETKIGAISTLARKATTLAIGGALAVPFLKAKGFPTGKSPVAQRDVSLARTLLRTRRNILLPQDVVVAASPTSPGSVRAVDDVRAGEVIYDIGPETIRRYAAEVRGAQTIVWNGPLGLFEVPRFSHGTRAIALIIGARAKGRAYGVVGGGETIAALEQVGVTSCIDWVSTGGGAMLEFLEGKTLSGLAALRRSKQSVASSFRQRRIRLRRK